MPVASRARRRQPRMGRPRWSRQGGGACLQPL